MADDEVLVERHGAVAHLVLNRPEKRNPLGPGFSPAMHRALDKVEADPGIAAVVLTGNGPVFCGGGDVSEIMSPEPTDLEREFDLIRGYNRVVSRIYHFEQPIIAAVNGPAVGGGACLAMACDIAIAAEGARYDFAFGRIGLAGADMGATHLLQRLVVRCGRRTYCSRADPSWRHRGETGGSSSTSSLRRNSSLRRMASRRR